MRLNRIRPPSIINGFIEAITSLRHDFRDWLQDRMIEWSVLIGSRLGRISRLGFCTAILATGKTCL